MRSAKIIKELGNLNIRRMINAAESVTSQSGVRNRKIKAHEQAVKILQQHKKTKTMILKP